MGRVPFSYECYWYPKEADDPEAYQDAFSVNTLHGRAAIADGVSSALFSGPWATILTRAVVENPPPADDVEAIEAWLGPHRVEWAQHIDLGSLNYFQRRKMASMGNSAFATLLWVEIRERTGAGVDHPPDYPAELNEDFPSSVQCYDWECTAIGDCCLFHVRGDKLLKSFPLNCFDELNATPSSLASKGNTVSAIIEPKSDSGQCLQGDWLVLVTDAFAGWILGSIETSGCVDWNRFDKLGFDGWTTLVEELRTNFSIRHDDTTLLILKVGPCDGEHQTIESEFVSMDKSETLIVEEACNEVRLQDTEACKGMNSEERIQTGGNVAATSDEIIADDGGLTSDDIQATVAPTQLLSSLDDMPSALGDHLGDQDEKLPAEGGGGTVNNEITE